MAKVTSDLENSNVKVMAKVKPTDHIWGLEFDQSICLLIVSWQLDHFWLRYSKFHIWPWKFKVKFMVKVKVKSKVKFMVMVKVKSGQVHGQI